MLRLTSWNHNDLGPDEAGLDLVLALEPGGLGGSLAVGEVGGHPGSVHNVVQVELGHSGVQLQQQGEGLSNTWGGNISEIIARKRHSYQWTPRSDNESMGKKSLNMKVG